MKEGESELSTFLRGFRKRWNIQTNDEQRFDELHSRVLHTVNSVLGRELSLRPDLSNEYLRITGQPPRFYVPGGREDLRTTAAWKAVEGSKEVGDLVFHLESLFHLSIHTTTLERLAAGLREDIRASGIPIALTSSHGTFLFYRKGAQLLDDHVVNADLEWMFDYPKASAAFENALTHSTDPDKQQEMLNWLRVSLEEFLRQLLGNKKSLENNKDALLKWMDDHGTNTETRNMMRDLFLFYCSYQNNHVKHGDDWKPAEVDFILYLTATFIHLLVELGS